MLSGACIIEIDSYFSSLLNYRFLLCFSNKIKWCGLMVFMQCACVLLFGSLIFSSERLLIHRRYFDFVRIDKLTRQLKSRNTEVMHIYVSVLQFHFSQYMFTIISWVSRCFWLLILPSPPIDTDRPIYKNNRFSDKR